MMEEKKKTSGFTIISNNPTDGHGGYGVGSLSLENISPVLIDVLEKEAFVEMGALHARSSVEKGIKFLPNKAEVSSDAKPYWVVWVAIERGEDGVYYAGVTACEMTVDRESRRGYKQLPEHVNRLDKALKRKIIIDHMDEASKKVLGEFLKDHDEEMWNRSAEELRSGLLGE